MSDSNSVLSTAAKYLCPVLLQPIEIENSNNGIKLPILEDSTSNKNTIHLQIDSNPTTTRLGSLDRKTKINQNKTQLPDNCHKLVHNQILTTGNQTELNKLITTNKNNGKAEKTLSPDDINCTITKPIKSKNMTQVTSCKSPSKHVSPKITDFTCNLDLLTLTNQNTFNQTGLITNLQTEKCKTKCKIAPPSPLSFKNQLEKFWPVTVTEEWSNASYEQIYSKVRATGLPNYLKAKIPLPSGLVISEWESLLINYHDNELVAFLNYGWPVDYTYNRIPTPTLHNHKEKQDYALHIKKYITTELHHNALLGPFYNFPFKPWCQFSPIMTRKKKHSCERRIIVDLSHPKGKSVNAGIKKGYYLGKELTYTLPGINNIITKLKYNTTNKYLWTIDLERAYRQLRTDPLSVPLLGISFNDKMYLDIAPPFGCRTSSMACARTTNAVVYLLNNMGHDVICYLDDFIGVEDTYDKACVSYHDAMLLLNKLGLAVSNKKCIPPTQKLTWLGYSIDAKNNIIKIPEDKITEVIEECKLWSIGSKVTRKYIQHVAGKLNFISKCVIATKTFMNRILEFLRNSPFKGTIQINESVLQDIKWFINFAESFNGLILLPTKPKVSYIIECDACLVGGGGFSETKYFSQVFNEKFTNLKLHISQIEAINLIAAMTSLHPLNTFEYDITILTDNMSAQQVLQTGSGRDKILTACARYLWKFSALNNCVVNVVHKAGSELVIADSLSRAAINNNCRKIATDYCVNNNLSRILVDHFQLYNDILCCI